MNIIQERLEKLSGLTLLNGSHPNPGAGMCVMEAVAWVAGEPHSDNPQCACPVIAAFLRRWNDRLPDDETRTRLLGPLVLKLVGSRSTPDVELRRAYLAVDWSIRVNLPAWLELTDSLREHASALRESPEVVDRESANSARELVAKAPAAAAAAAYATYASSSAAAYAADASSAADAAYATYASSSAAAYAADASSAADAAYAAYAAYAAAAYAADAAAAAYAAYAADAAAAADASSAAYAAAAYATYASSSAAERRKKIADTRERMRASAVELVERMISVTEVL